MTKLLFFFNAVLLFICLALGSTAEKKQPNIRFKIVEMLGASNSLNC